MNKFSVLILLISGFTTLVAQNTYEFLRLDQSPRAAALAGSFVSNNDDPNVIFYNPAGMGTLENQPISFSFVKHLLDINSASIAYSREFEGLGRFGAAIQYINYGDFVEANSEGVKTGNFGAGELAGIIGYTNELDDNFYYGINVKLIYSGIAERSSFGMAADLGLQYHWPEERWSFGFSVLNLGSQITSYYNIKEDLPLDVRFGFSKTLLHLPLTIFASLNKLNQESDSFGDRFNKFTFGGEFKLSKVIRLRLGYDNEKRKDLKIGTTAGLAGFNLGLGIIINKYNVDYAFSSMGSIGALHRIGVSTNI